MFPLGQPVLTQGDLLLLGHHPALRQGSPGFPPLISQPELLTCLLSTQLPRGPLPLLSRAWTTLEIPMEQSSRSGPGRARCPQCSRHCGFHRCPLGACQTREAAHCLHSTFPLWAPPSQPPPQQGTSAHLCLPKTSVVEDTSSRRPAIYNRNTLHLELQSPFVHL